MSDRGTDAIYLGSGSPLGKSGVLVWDIITGKIWSVEKNGIKFHCDVFPLLEHHPRLTHLDQLFRPVEDNSKDEVDNETQQAQLNKSREEVKQWVPREEIQLQGPQLTAD
jgi:hypothetical protein